MIRLSMKINLERYKLGKFNALISPKVKERYEIISKDLKKKHKFYSFKNK